MVQREFPDQMTIILLHHFYNGFTVKMVQRQREFLIILLHVGLFRSFLRLFFTFVALSRRAPWFRWPSLSAEIGAARSTFAETLSPRQVTLEFGSQEP